MSDWTVVIRGDFYLPHLINMLNQYTGNSEQRSCADDVIAQIREQMTFDELGDPTARPRVVIDPEDLDHLEALVRALRHSFTDAGLSHLTMRQMFENERVETVQEALRSLIATPLKPAPTEDGWYTYDGGSQLLIFRLTRGQWFAMTDIGTADECEWGYIEQALGVHNLVPLIPQVEGVPA